jgi:hypothetical protein
MALIQFIAQGPGSVISNLSGSGLGFYGSDGFGASVGVGNWQGTTFVTDSTGTVQGPQCHNIQYINSASGLIDSATSGVKLTQIPNYECPLNIRFTNATPVNVQNAKVMIFDRTNINNAASGVETAVAEVVHPDTVQNNNGSGDDNWQVFNYQTPGSSTPLSASPGTSGQYGGTQNATHSDTEHDWYLALSASPDSIGAKNLYGLYCYLEYL